MTFARHHIVLSLIALIIAATTTFAHAQETAIRGVVEFFTSQGCNACPPADEVLSGLSQDGDVIALGYHVDYWNYRGWKDTFSQHENTVLQAGYMKMFGKRALFTPQAVINGQVGVNGSDMVAIRSQLVATSQQSNLVSGLPITLHVTRTATDVNLIAEQPGNAIPENARLFAIRIEPERKVLIESGENKGKMITYRNIVRERRVLQNVVVGANPAKMSLKEFETSGDGSSWIFIVQQVMPDSLPGKILGAARLSK